MSSGISIPVDRSDVQRAIATYQAAIREGPEDWQLQFNLARFFFTLRDYADAVPQFQSAAKLMPYDPSITVGLSAALAHLGKTDEALKVLRELLARDPGCRSALQAVKTVKASEGAAP